MSWRSGPREAVKRPDPLARDPHPLTVAHWQLVKGKADEKMRRLLAQGS